MAPSVRFLVHRIRVPVPRGRDPYVNARLVSLGVDRCGAERFWISSCNFTSGSLGVAISEEGEHRLYPLNKPIIGYCYTAAAENPETVWLCVGLNQVARLDLRTGRYRLYKTGSEPAFVCCGGRFDPDTRNFFAVGYLDRGGVDGTTAIEFDTRSRKAVVHRDIGPDQFMYCCLRQPDGAYVGSTVCPGFTLVHWDPRRGMVKTLPVQGPDGKPLTSGPSFFIDDDDGRIYFPSQGWYSPKNRVFDPSGPRPEREMTWFERHGREALGCEGDGAGGSRFCIWNLDTGKVRNVATVPACSAQGATRSRNGKLISVNLYGEFRRHDLATGRMELFRRLPTDSLQPVDHVMRMTPDRLIGSNFITQRFWQINLKTGKGFDCGRAAPGGGQVQKFWKIGKKVYLTSYTTGNLMEFDPDRPPNFPENPCVVAEPPESMRPVAFANDSRFLYYSSNAHYGHLGCTVTRYDTRTGLYRYRVNPFPGQAIRSLWLDARRGELFGHTTFRADCDSCPSTANYTGHVRLRAEDLAVLEALALPSGLSAEGILGPLDSRRLLCRYQHEGQPRLVAVALDGFGAPAPADLRELPVKANAILYAGRPGHFVLQIDESLELWDLRCDRLIRTLCREKGIRRVSLQGRDLLLVRARDILLWENVLD